MLIDISQEIFSCNIYPGDPSPDMESIQRISNGDICNLTSFSMCAHNGTHIDAPYHFLNNGKTIDQIDLKTFVGECYIALHNGDVTAEDAVNILEKARTAEAASRILIAGKATVTAEAAHIFVKAGIILFGNESQTVGPEDFPAEVHKIFLGSEVVLLEGVVLTNIEEGKYRLIAVPLNLSGCDGAPCRAFLVK